MIFVDEASKLDSGHWGELAKAVERHGAQVRAVGHDGQHEAIRLPGLFSEMLRDPRIPRAELARSAGTATLTTPRRCIRGCATTRSPSTKAAGSTPSRSSKQHHALKLYDTRAQAMGGIVDEWDRGATAMSRPSRR